MEATKILTRGKMFRGVLAACFVVVVMCSVVAFSTQVVPCGVSIQDELLDGVIGAEWDDAASFFTTIYSTSTCEPERGYPLKILVKHDSKYLYIAIMGTRILSWTPMAWVCFDVQDRGNLYSKGDDSVILPLTGAAIVSDIDRAYYKDGLLPARTPGPWQNYGAPPKKDRSLGGTNDKRGAARASKHGYTFEIKIDMDSGDYSHGDDLRLYSGTNISASFGLMDSRLDSLIVSAITPNLLFLASKKIGLDIE